MSNSSISNEKSIWDQTAEMHGGFSVVLSSSDSQQFLNDPIELIHALARYKFAAKMACKKGRILEVGCKSGLGAPILAEFAESYYGIDVNISNIQSAASNWRSPKFRFECIDFMNRKIDSFDAIISLHHTPAQATDFPLFLGTSLLNLKPAGILLLGYTAPPIPLIKQSLEQMFCYTFCFSIVHGNLISKHLENATDYFYLSFNRKFNTP